MTDPLPHWLATETTRSGAASARQDHLHAAYAAACARSNRPILSKQLFGRRLRALLARDRRSPADDRRQAPVGVPRDWAPFGNAAQSRPPIGSGVRGYL